MDITLLLRILWISIGIASALMAVLALNHVRGEYVILERDKLNGGYKVTVRGDLINASLLLFGGLDIAGIGLLSAFGVPSRERTITILVGVVLVALVVLALALNMVVTHYRRLGAVGKHPADGDAPVTMVVQTMEVSVLKVVEKPAKAVTRAVSKAITRAVTKAVTRAARSGGGKKKG